MPDVGNRIYLGEFSNCRDAVREAKKHYPQSNGCYYCSKGMSYRVTPLVLTEPRHKRRRRRTEPAKKAPAYERENGPLTAKQLRAIKKLVPQGRMKKIKSSLF